jgi:hypothetical protein
MQSNVKQCKAMQSWWPFELFVFFGALFFDITMFWAKLNY